MLCYVRWSWQASFAVPSVGRASAPDICGAHALFATDAGTHDLFHQNRTWKGCSRRKNVFYYPPVPCWKLSVSRVLAHWAQIVWIKNMLGKKSCMVVPWQSYTWWVPKWKSGSLDQNALATGVPHLWCDTSSFQKVRYIVSRDFTFWYSHDSSDSVFVRLRLWVTALCGVSMGWLGIPVSPRPEHLKQTLRSSLFSEQRLSDAMVVIITVT